MQAFKHSLLIFTLMLGLTATVAGFVDGQNHASPSVYTLIETLETEIEPESKQPQLFDQHQRATGQRGSLFLAESQTQPNYQQVDERLFSVEHKDSTYPHAPPPQPWFLQATASKNRVSGWKDGNNLYSARITYHN